jgi:predicted mannosyl-3-phosphoglycerate phosphatase (HAD superfamily)
MTHEPVPIVVVSAADDALRDRGPVSTARAAEALRLLRDERVALVLYSNHTRSELELIQQELGILHPFVSEGGAALFVPTGYFAQQIPGARRRAGHDVVEIGSQHADVLQRLRAAAGRNRIDMLTYSDMSVEEVARECRITLLRASLAKLREYVEPCRPVYTGQLERPHFIRLLRGARLRAVQRGSFEHVGGLIDPAAAINLLCGLYRRVFGRFVTVGLADAGSGDGLLGLMDRRVIVHDDEGSAGAVDVACWAESIVDIVRDVRASVRPTGNGQPLTVHG